MWLIRNYNYCCLIHNAFIIIMSIVEAIRNACVYYKYNLVVDCINKVLLTVTFLYHLSNVYRKLNYL